MKLSDLISIEYEERARNKPNCVIHSHINMLLRFSAPFSRNMNAEQVYVPFPIGIKTIFINEIGEEMEEASPSTQRREYTPSPRVISRPERGRNVEFKTLRRSRQRWVSGSRLSWLP